CRRRATASQDSTLRRSVGGHLPPIQPGVDRRDVHGSLRRHPRYTHENHVRQLPRADRGPPPGSMMQPGYDCEVVVVGLGALGSCRLGALAGRAVRTIGIDQFDPPHEQGSSHGETRVIRSAIIEGAAYLPLIRRAFALWNELAAEAQRELLVQTGVLFIS